MKIKVFTVPYNYRELKNIQVTEQGYIKADYFDEDECWHLCNWSCWAEEKPENLLSDLEVVNSDVIFYNPKTERYHLALPSGWYVGNSLEEITQHIKGEIYEQTGN